MPRIPARFAPLLSVTSEGGARLTATELEGALPTATTDEVRTLRSQAMDAVQDGAALAKLTGTTAPTVPSGPVTALKDHTAGRDLLEGRLELSRANGRDHKEAVLLLQRALMKIGAHHPEARNRPELLMLPWGADGDLGGATVAAVNSALTMAGREDLKLASTDAPVTKDVAQVIEQLLTRTPRILHPSLINAPVTVTPEPPPPPAPSATIFGKAMMSIERTALDPKWEGVLARTDAEAPLWDGDRAALPPAARYLLSELDGMAGRSPAFQLNRVNSLINGWLYASDQSNFGASDYWASPLEFMRKQRGDCEDYCILKAMALKRLGFSEDQMKMLIVIERDSGIAHAVLAVDMPDGTYILDNQATQVLKAEDVVTTSGEPRYHPVVAFARDERWLFVNA